VDQSAPALTPPPPPAPPGALSSPVRFSSGVSGTRRNYWKLNGAGELTLADGQLRLRGGRHRWFWFSAGQEITLSTAQLRNVAQAGRRLQFEVRVADGSWQPLLLWAAAEPAARELSRRLPQERTTDFARVQAEQSGFHAALGALGQSVAVTRTLVVLNCLVFAGTAAAGAGIFAPDAAVLIQWGSNFGPLTLSGEWWRLFTSMFLHFGILHLLLNMWALYSLGQLTERLYGSAYYLLLYVFAGLCGSLASDLVHPSLNSAGASGAIFGVIGGLLAFMVNPATRIAPSVAAAQRNSALVFVAYNLFNGVAHAGIDNSAHIGGLLGGFAIGWLLARPLEPAARLRPLPRLGVALAAGAAVLAALSWPLVHRTPERELRVQLGLYGLEETRLLQQQRELAQALKDKRISEHEWGRRAVTELAPRWARAADRISAVRLPAGSPLLPLQRSLLQYLDDERQGFALLGAGLRDDDTDQAQRGNALLQKTGSDVQQIKALADRSL
jgi:membrane associated rhomboid family serine protease